MESALDPKKPFYLPQGTHPLTGQVLPPLLNNPGRLARGEDTAALSNTISSSSFAFQAINNNYNTTNSAVPGILEKLSRFKDVVKSVENGRIQNSSVITPGKTINPKRKAQLQFNPHPKRAIGDMPRMEIPRSPESIRIS